MVLCFRPNGGNVGCQYFRKQAGLQSHQFVQSAADALHHSRETSHVVIRRVAGLASEFFATQAATAAATGHCFWRIQNV
jgi:DNA primase